MATTVLHSDSLMVTLVSSSSSDIFPANTNYSFVNQFKSQLSLDPAYRVSLQEIHYKPLTRKKNHPKGERLQPPLLATTDNGKPRMLCCYCDIIEPVIVGSSYAPLLAIIPLDAGNIGWITDPLPHRLIVHRFSEITIKLTDADGYAFPLDGGVIVRLQFTRV